MRSKFATAIIPLSFLVGTDSDTASAVVFDLEWRGVGGRRSGILGRPQK